MVTNQGCEKSFAGGTRSVRFSDRKFITRPVTSLGHKEGRRVFQEGLKLFELCLIFLNYVQNHFQGGKKICREVSPPCATPGYQHVYHPPGDFLFSF